MTTTQFTDRLGNPVAVGDKIVLAVAAGRSSAQLIDTEIIDLVPLVPHRDYLTSQPSGAEYYMRADQAQKRDCTRFRRIHGTQPDKLFVLKYALPTSKWEKDRTGKDFHARSTDRVRDFVKVG